MTVLDFVDAELAALEARGRLRGARIVEARRGPDILVDGRWVVSFSSNDYLGLADAPELVAAAHAALTTQGVGAGASRLITGTSDEVAALERELAAFHGMPAALVFGSGYAANTGVIPALVGRGDAIFSDELNHASIIDGARLSRAEIHVWKHRDVDQLERMLDGGRWRRRLIVSESVFSMDGDLARLVELRRLAREHAAILMVDDAHAVGIAGEGGRGYGVEVEADLVIGTLGKAFGTAGAYVLSSLNISQYLWNRCRSLVFSTAQPPAIAAASRAALALIASPEGAALRAALDRNIRSVRELLVRLGARIDPRATSPIIPVIVGDDRAAVACSDFLLDRGLLVQAIRPPTVPEGTSRLRIAVSANHSAAHLEALTNGLVELKYRSMILPE